MGSTNVLVGPPVAPVDAADVPIYLIRSVSIESVPVDALVYQSIPVDTRVRPVGPVGTNEVPVGPVGSVGGPCLFLQRPSWVQRVSSGPCRCPGLSVGPSRSQSMRRYEGRSSGSSAFE